MKLPINPVAAVVVSFFIMKVSVRLLIPCVDELLEKSLPEDVEKEIEQTVLSFPGVSQPMISQQDGTADTDGRPDRRQCITPVMPGIGYQSLGVQLLALNHCILIKYLL